MRVKGERERERESTATRKAKNKLRRLISIKIAGRVKRQKGQGKTMEDSIGETEMV